MPKIRMKQRTIRESWWWDKHHKDLSATARLMWIGLAWMSDDHGFVQIDNRHIALQIFPFDKDPLPMIGAAVTELIARDVIAPYTVDDVQYARIRRFKYVVLKVKSKKRNPVPDNMKDGNPEWRKPVEPTEDEKVDAAIPGKVPEDTFSEETVAPPPPPIRRESQADDLRDFGAQINSRDTRQEWETIIRKWGIDAVASSVKAVADNHPRGRATLTAVSRHCFSQQQGNGTGVNVPELIRRLMSEQYMEQAINLASSRGLNTNELPHLVENLTDERTLRAIAATVGM